MLQIALPRGVKRATLFALSVTLAGQACASDNEIAIYGAPPPASGASGGSGGSGSGVGGHNAAGNGGSNANTGGNAGSSMGNPVPVYGAPVAPEAGGSTGLPAPDAGDDAGADAGDDAG